jgi:hypothetical protein
MHNKTDDRGVNYTVAGDEDEEDNRQDPGPNNAIISNDLIDPLLFGFNDDQRNHSSIRSSNNSRPFSFYPNNNLITSRIRFFYIRDVINL